MHRTLLIDVLRRLDARQLSRLQELAHSDYWHKNERVRSLCRELSRHAPEFSGEDLEKARLWKKLYRPEPYDERRMNNLVSDLLQLVYDFLCLERFRRDDNLAYDLLTSALLEHDLPIHAERIAKRWERQQGQRSVRSFDYYQQEYHRHDALDRLSLTISRRRYDDNLQHKSDQLDRAYHLNKLRLACDMISRNAVVKAGYECRFIDAVCAHYESGELGLSDHPVATIYYLTLKMLRNEAADERFALLQVLLEDHWALLPEEELRTLYQYLLNYGVKQINSGRTEFYSAVFPLYQTLLERRILYHHDRLSPWAYTNIITAGFRLGRYDWVERFIQDYRQALPPEEEYNVYNYNLAALYYERGDYDQALTQLHNVEFTDAFYHVAAKLIQLKIYFHQEASEPLYSLLQASRQYLHRNRQLSDYQRRSNLNFLSWLQKIYQLQQSEGRIGRDAFSKKAAALQAELAGTQPIANKGWLEDALRVAGSLSV